MFDENFGADVESNGFDTFGGFAVNGTDSTFLLTQDFSDEFKLKLAMLKIAADNQIIPDTGMRINSDTCGCLMPRSSAAAACVRLRAFTIL